MITHELAKAFVKKIRYLNVYQTLGIHLATMTEIYSDYIHFLYNTWFFPETTNQLTLNITVFEKNISHSCYYWSTVSFVKEGL